MSRSRTVVPTGTRRTRSVAVGAVPVGALAVAPALGGVVAAVPEVEEGAEAFVGLEDHRPAAASVAPVGPPRGTYFSRRKLTQPRPPSPART